jgi:hypothetical protein
VRNIAELEKEDHLINTFVELGCGAFFLGATRFAAEPSDASDSGRSLCH